MPLSRFIAPTETGGPAARYHNAYARWRRARCEDSPLPPTARPLVFARATFGGSRFLRVGAARRRVGPPGRIDLGVLNLGSRASVLRLGRAREACDGALRAGWGSAPLFARARPVGEEPIAKSRGRSTGGGGDLAGSAPPPVSAPPYLYTVPRRPLQGSPSRALSSSPIPPTRLREDDAFLVGSTFSSPRADARARRRVLDRRRKIAWARTARRRRSPAHRSLSMISPPSPRAGRSLRWAADGAHGREPLDPLTILVRLMRAAGPRDGL
jgi:hypothetical protein